MVMPVATKKPLGRPVTRGESSNSPGTRLDVKMTPNEARRFREALAPGETLASVVRGLVDRWTTERLT